MDSATWGDTVQIKKDAPPAMHPGSLGRGVSDDTPIIQQLWKSEQPNSGEDPLGPGATSFAASELESPTCNAGGDSAMSSSSVQPVTWLMKWYQSRCDGDWEHQHGIRIGTLDNPGWSLDVDLLETSEEGRTAPQELVERSEHDWLFVEVKDNVFRARGGPGNLDEMIEAFRKFVSFRKS